MSTDTKWAITAELERLRRAHAARHMIAIGDILRASIETLEWVLSQFPAARPTKKPRGKTRGKAKK